MRLLAVVSVVAWLLGGGGVVASASPPTGSAHSGVVKEYVCTGDYFKPRSILIACGDGGARVARLHWTSWTTHQARGVGVWKQNNCTPDCAQGRFIDYPVRLRLSQVILRRHVKIFGRVVATFPRAAPPYPAYAHHRVVVMNHGKPAP